ncbi:MAG: ATP-binding cassette domain-containing protein [Lachnospiraceae bacterium]|nr:ATP-binding cassette domain-containing protein [Lachnospiraceae bacterium]
MSNEIRLDRIYKKYGETAVFEGFSETFGAGETVAVMGPSGTGKTTLLRLIMGLEKPDSGEIIGIENEKFACVFQENRLIEHCNAVENIRLVLDVEVPDEAIIEELKNVGIGVSNPEELTKPVSQFSGGMKRRVAIVRALASQADTVILDEPFKGLDEELKKAVIGYVDDKIGTARLILVTHDEDEARQLCGRIVRIPEL